MAAVYPGGIPDAPTRGTNLDDDDAHTIWHDREWEEIRAITQTLGIHPEGSFATAEERFDDVDSKARRMGCGLSRAAVQSMPNGAATVVSWDTESVDTDSFWTSGTDITIPQTAVWILHFRVNTASAITAGSDLRFIVGGASRIGPAATGQMSTDFTLAMVIGSATVVQAAFYNTGATMNITANIDIYRVSI